MSNSKKLHKLPPNNAWGKIVAPRVNLVQQLTTMGVETESLEPIDWRTQISAIKTDSGVKLSLSPILDQGSCGNCWAMSSTSVLTDRFIIQKQIANLQLNPEITTQLHFSKIQEFQR